jgi:predicted translin family RNA/ssDNA-binding protein
MPEFLEELIEKLRSSEVIHRAAAERAEELRAKLVRVENAHDAAMKSPDGMNILTIEEEALDKLVKDTVLSSDYYNNIVQDSNCDSVVADGKPHPRAPRRAGISSCLEDYARYKSFRYFLEQGKLIAPNNFLVSQDNTERNILTDEEYLGACIGLCSELASYGITRASTAGTDHKAIGDVEKARDIVSRILEELMQFDFRNGNLRKKYDSTKYKLKALETILYELSVATTLGGCSNDVKKPKLDSGDGDATMQDEDIIPKEGIEAIRKRLEHRDKMREQLIKTCRDGQKAAKQAIFALHRGDTDRALKLLQQCEDCVTKDLMPILVNEPDLRGGSFSGVLEEYVEAYLFYAWLKNDDEAKKDEPSGKVLSFSDLPLSVSTDEYLGGLLDLTGEIGRFAVARGTSRDKKSVQLCLDTNKSIHNSIKMIGKMPASMFKKKTTLKVTVEKLERIMYEISLMEMAGRKEYASALDSPHDDN